MSHVASQIQPEGSPVLRLDLETNREAPSVARAAIAGFSEHQDLAETTLTTLTLLVSEVVTNAVIHPEVDRRGDIQLRARVAGGVIRV